MSGKMLYAAVFSLAVIFGVAFQTSFQTQNASLDTFENPYRRTQFGWQDSRDWTIQDETECRESVHPLWVSLGLAFLVLGVVVWSTEDDDLAHLFGNDVVPNQKRAL